MNKSQDTQGTEKSALMMEEQEAALERMYIEAYLEGKGYSLHTLRELPEGEATRLLAAASAYASLKLAEVEIRARFMHEIHGVAPPLG